MKSQLGPKHDGRVTHDRRSRRVALATIGPQQVGGLDVILRPGRLSDGPAWREARMSNEKRLAKAFGDPHRSWSEDCSLVAWAEHLAWQKRSILAGELVTFLALTTQGRVLAEFFYLIEPRSGVAECSMWTARSLPPQVTKWISAQTNLRVLELPSQVPWIVAPVAVGNPAPEGLLKLAGYELVAISRKLRMYDGVPTDHAIWRLQNTSGVRHHLRRMIDQQIADSEQPTPLDA